MSFYTNTSTQFQPESGVLNNGAVSLIHNQDVACNTGSYPISLTGNVYKTIMIVADTWATAEISIYVSLDGVNNWVTLTDFYGNSLNSIKQNTYTSIILKGVFIKAVMIGSGTNITVALAG